MCGRMALRGWWTCGKRKKKRDGDAGVELEKSVGGEELHIEEPVERKEAL